MAEIPSRLSILALRFDFGVPKHTIHLLVIGLLLFDVIFRLLRFDATFGRLRFRWLRAPGFLQFWGLLLVIVVLRIRTLDHFPLTLPRSDLFGGDGHILHPFPFDLAPAGLDDVAVFVTQLLGYGVEVGLYQVSKGEKAEQEAFHCYRKVAFEVLDQAHDEFCLAHCERTDGL